MNWFGILELVLLFSSLGASFTALIIANKKYKKEKTSARHKPSIEHSLRAQEESSESEKTPAVQAESAENAELAPETRSDDVADITIPLIDFNAEDSKKRNTTVEASEVTGATSQARSAVVQTEEQDTEDKTESDYPSVDPEAETEIFPQTQKEMAEEQDTGTLGTDTPDTEKLGLNWYLIVAVLSLITSMYEIFVLSNVWNGLFWLVVTGIYTAIVVWGVTRSRQSDK
ncbi:hypothetical protein [Alloscardovia criceti]|uniref:hypothetical protein n=1 Tax=Alloscardovia criceti TaxID=356828 RepID=UPI000366BCF5|nr:hypothetical protein [Alloscardovia criceti]